MPTDNAANLYWNNMEFWGMFFLYKKRKYAQKNPKNSTLIRILSTI